MTYSGPVDLRAFLGRRGARLRRAGAAAGRGRA